jgi:hypothetical protein
LGIGDWGTELEIANRKSSGDWGVPSDQEGFTAKGAKDAKRTLVFRIQEMCLARIIHERAVNNAGLPKSMANCTSDRRIDRAEDMLRGVDIHRRRLIRPGQSTSRVSIKPA